MADEFKGRIFYEDNLAILRKIESGSINLIYIDPPFNTGKKQSRTQIRTVKSENGDRKGFKGNIYETVLLGTKEYEDDYGESFIKEFIEPRLVEAYRILAKNGSLYFHIDYREVHYCKILLDKIFGRECFINEIIWAYDYGGKSKTRWPTKHDNILFYAKDPEDYIFNAHAIDREPYMAPGLVGPEKAANGKLPTDTWWHTIVGTNSKERTGYPTQKPLGVINRIVQASSLPGQTVLDFFAGSGTIGESCLRLGRNFILIDNNPIALEVMAKRFPKSSEIEWINFDPTPYQLEDKKIISQDEETANPEFVMLASLAMYIRNDLEEQSEIWEGSPFSWVTQLPAASKGKLGRNLIASWCAAKGLTIDYPKDIKASLIINGFRIATKFSTLWSEGSYKFQQIRNEGYEYLICLGISPSEAHCWVFNREYIVEKAKPQHKGADLFLTINPENPPDWACIGGGKLDEAYHILKNLKKKI
ncbi:MAG TPA: site-specific DNA-methyltransferase [Anaerolineaceae bacterium]|nr:site-specific DNA-methyltransferase [Anaerolineaceae bacterium]